MKLTKHDKELIEKAWKLTKKNADIYPDENLIVGCVIKGKSGKIYKGVNMKTSHSVCAEQVALGQALANGEREFDTIVATKLDDETGEARVVSPCGVCRYIFDKFNIKCNVIVSDEKSGEILKVKPKELLPYPYIRNKKTNKRGK